MRSPAAVLLALSVLVGGCGAVRPPRPPNPTPTPTPTPPASTALLLKAAGKMFTDAAGDRVEIAGYSSCCTSEDPEPSPDWSLWAKPYQDFLLPKYGSAGRRVLVHMRLGPWTPNEWFPEAIREVGGPYLVQPDGRVDLAQWNPKYWARVEQIHEFMRQAGVNAEDDLVDGWACKKRKGFWEAEGMPRYHPWLAENNIQGIDAYSLCGKREIVSGSADPVQQVHERWIRKAVEVTGRYDNVIYQDGNEISLVDSYSPAWTASIGNLIRDEEAKRGYVRHLYGTNAAASSAQLEQVDYATIHTSTPMRQQDCGTTAKPCRNSEYNPDPPFRGEQMQLLYCDARAKGLYWDFWRHGMSLAEAEKAWNLMDPAKCAATVTGCDDIPNEGAVEIDRPASMYTKEINDTHVAIIGSTNGPIAMQQKAYQVTFAEKFRQLHPTLCAGIQTDDHGLVDEVCVGDKVAGANRCDLCQGYKVFNCRTAQCPDDNPDCGCDSGTAQPAPQAARDAWRRPGTQRAATVPLDVVPTLKAFTDSSQEERAKMDPERRAYMETVLMLMTPEQPTGRVRPSKKPRDKPWFGGRP